MSPYTHLTLKDRESILLGINTVKTLEIIARGLKRSKSRLQPQKAVVMLTRSRWKYMTRQLTRLQEDNEGNYDLKQ
jgi:hypothetical protein